MPFAQRHQGTISALYAGLQPGRAEEYLADNHPTVAAYYAPLIAAGLIRGRVFTVLYVPTVFPED